MPMFQFRKTETRPDFFAVDMLPAGAPVYAVYSRWSDVPTGWVAKHHNEHWFAWNAHGDFWTSYGRTRDDAADSMLRASWKSFRRNGVLPPRS